MKLKYKFAMNEVGGRTVAVAVGEDLEKFGGFIKMNGIGAYIFNMLKNDVTKIEIIDAIQRDFVDADKAEVEKTVRDFIEKLERADVLE